MVITLQDSRLSVLPLLPLQAKRHCVVHTVAVTVLISAGSLTTEGAIEGPIRSISHPHVA